MNGIRIQHIVQSLKISGLISIFAICLTNTVVKAEEAAILDCISKYTKLGVSPDAALAECKKNTLKDCIERLTASKVVVKAISKSEKGYLVDLGDNDTRWLEGKAWKNKGCKAYTKGPYKRQSDKHRTFWGKQRSYEWFRQGWCSNEEIELEQNYSLNEAKTLCEVGFDPTKNQAKDKPITEN